MSIVAAAAAGASAQVRVQVGGGGFAGPPPTAIVFEDPVTGREVWRLTTDGAVNGVLFSIGDQSSESRAFSDCADTSQGTPPGGVGGSDKIDLFILPPAG